MKDYFSLFPLIVFLLPCLFLVIIIFKPCPIIHSCFANEEKSLYIVLVEGDSLAFVHGHHLSSQEEMRVHLNSEAYQSHAKLLEDSHNQLLESTLDIGSYKKLHGFTHLANGFSLHTTPSQAEKLKKSPRVKMVQRDRGAKLMTTYTPDFLNLPKTLWSQNHNNNNNNNNNNDNNNNNNNNNYNFDNDNVGEGIIIGFVDSGINPSHPSFKNKDYDGGLWLINNTDDASSRATWLCPENTGRFCGACETGARFPRRSCNGKIVSARFFAAGAQAVSTLNASVDFLSPFDAVGHGSHVASTAAGNSRVPVMVDGYYYGTASGMAPRARIAVYKAIYPTVGTLTDVLAAIDQAVKDGVDILTLSVGPDEPAEDTVTFLDVFEIFMLLARRAGVFVVQAAGNKGPGSSTVVSFSPWSVGVSACTTDRSYPATLCLGNGRKIAGVGLSGKCTAPDCLAPGANLMFRSGNLHSSSDVVINLGPTFGDGKLKYKLVLAKDAVYVNSSFPKTPPYTEECQFPEALDPMVVGGSVVICKFSAGFYNQTSTVTSILNTAKVLGFMGFILVANPTYGDFLTEPVPLPVPGIMITKTADAKIISKYYEARTKRNEQGTVIRYGGRASIAEGRGAFFDRQIPTVSRFSSRGPDIIDSHRNPADVLKPDFVAPGQQIWAAWSPLSALDPIFEGSNFALMSGTSMAAPHIAGIAALIKQHNPSWTPSMIASAISTTATKYDHSKEIILSEGFNLDSFNPSTPFDIGSGLVNPERAVDPGLVFIPGEGEYVAFLCSLPNINQGEVEAASGGSCNHTLRHPADLNLPSVTIISLAGSQVLKRNVINVGDTKETYLCAVLPPNGVTVDVSPTWFTVTPNGSQALEITLNVTQTKKDFSFGEIVLTGSLDHIVRMPLSVLPVSIS